MFALIPNTNMTRNGQQDADRNRDEHDKGAPHVEEEEDGTTSATTMSSSAMRDRRLLTALPMSLDLSYSSTISTPCGSPAASSSILVLTCPITC